MDDGAATWTRFTGAPVVTADGTLFVSATLSGVWRRDFATGVWSELALTPVPTGRVLAAACAPNGRVYTIRGTPITHPRVFRSKP